MAEFRCESIEKYGDCAVDREQWRGEERPIQCSFCCYYKPIMTNSEKIRAMTDEELSEFANVDGLTPWCKDRNPCPQMNNDPCDCRPCMLDWLKQECDENGT